MAGLFTWGGKILGALLTALYVFMAIGCGGGPGITPQSVSLYLSMAGLLLGLFKPLPGGVLAILGIAAFYGLDYHGYGRFPGGPVFPMFWVAGTLLIVGSLLRRRPATAA